MKLDVLAFGAHPDDVELGCAGLLLVEKANGKRVGIIDLTQGELGSRGTVETREKEALHAAEILQLNVRENLKMKDGFLQNDETNQFKIITTIRKYKPEVVVCNAPEDRHPDHGKSAQLVSDAAFLAGLIKIETTDNGIKQEAWRPKFVLHYIQDRYLKPDFVVDVTSVYEIKLKAIKAYETQFHHPGIEGPTTYISTPDFLESVVYRNKMFGKMVGVKFAEGFISKKMIGLSNLDSLIKENT
jgi:bacillithiol biosynthesis deacetylase BshB1